MKKVIVPLDFSPIAINALRFADRLAIDINAELIVMNVYDGGISNYDAGWPIDEPFSSVVPLLQQKLDTIIKEKCRSLNVKTILKDGDVKTTILDTVAETKADIVVMGTYGAGLVKKVLYGTNTAYTIANSKVPVIAVPEKYDYRSIDKIIYSTDLGNLEPELKKVNQTALLLMTSIEAIHFRYDTEDIQENKAKFDEVVNNNDVRRIKLVQKILPNKEALVSLLKEYVEDFSNAALVMFQEDRGKFEQLFTDSRTAAIADKLNIPLIAMGKLNA